MVLAQVAQWSQPVALPMWMGLGAWGVGAWDEGDRNSPPAGRRTGKRTPLVSSRRLSRVSWLLRSRVQVKEQLMFEQKQIEAAEERRKQREAKQYGKQVQLAKQKERNADKKRQIEQISKLRKQREKSVSGLGACRWGVA